MTVLPASLADHRAFASSVADVCEGAVRWAPAKSAWVTSMFAGATVGGLATVSPASVSIFIASTAFVLLFGHSLGSHRRLIHGSFDCPAWLDRVLVYSGVLVGLAGPIGLLRQHELRDYAQRLPDCHPYLRHGRSFWRDGWWQLHCELVLANPPRIEIEPRVANDRFYRFLERTWMVQQLPIALAFYVAGGWGFVFWGVCARVTAGVVGHWLIGYFAHNHGGMHHRVDDAAVQGRNVRGVALLTMGEGWHNNHHAFPGSARLGLYPGEWDPGWWMLLLMRKAGWVRNLRLPADLAPREELVAVDPLVHDTASATEIDVRSALRALRRNDAAACRLSTPAAHVAFDRLRGWIGNGAEVVHDPACGRLTFERDGRHLTGLPGLVLAWGRAAGVGRRAIAVALLPVVYALESARAWLERDRVEA